MPRKQFVIRMLGFILCIMISLPGSLVYAAGPMEAPAPGSLLPQFKIPGPDSPEVKAYLGLKDNKPFALSQVKTKLMLVEFFDVFCPVCQKNAPSINRLYNILKEDKNLGKDIKMMAITLGGQPKDVEVYKQTFKAELPMFGDPNKEIENKIKDKVKFVPLLLLLDKKGKVLMAHGGEIKNFDGLLAELRTNNK
jgi:thiol-disulfide isomerase/thioredoxin